ncbi:hypothetical protein Vadar_013085 [Vaccinium darrowii]|uniref:Uncharacterized protein n=1 Tax=Vaccinium darrowii TaxID=229202 RepID=A0ACB7Y6D3_9ERIC|nr:hypothetical protein Vadar_013085 [Vaccinium darrowii]
MQAKVSKSSTEFGVEHDVAGLDVTVEPLWSYPLWREEVFVEVAIGHVVGIKQQLPMLVTPSSSIAKWGVGSCLNPRLVFASAFF